MHKHITTAILTLAAASAATAQTAYFDNIVAGQASNNPNISVTVQASSFTDYDYDFVIQNNASSDDTTITGFYFEAGWEMLFSDRVFKFSSDAPGNFSVNRASPLQEGAIIPGWTRSLVSYEVGNLDDGVSPGQTAIVSFDALANSLSLQDIESRIGLSGFNIGLRLQNLPEQNSETTAFALAGLRDQDFLTDGENPGDGGGGQAGPGDPALVPTPSAAVMGLGALMGIALKRRRRDA